MATEMLRLSLFLGRHGSKAMRLSSNMPFQGVPSTKPKTLRLSVGGPKLITPCRRPSRNAPKWRRLLLTTFPL